MKHLWIGLLLLMCLLLFGALTSYGVQKVQAPLSEQLEQATKAGLGADWEQAAAFSAAAREHWKKHRNFLAAVVDHKPMEEIDSLFDELEVYREAQNSQLFAGLCQRLSQLAEAIGEACRLNWWNLL